MQTDLLDQIRAIDPLPEDLPAPPIALFPRCANATRVPRVRAPLASAPRSPSAPRSRCRSPPRCSVSRCSAGAATASSTSLPPSTRRRSPETAFTTCSSKAKRALSGFAIGAGARPIRCANGPSSPNARESSNWSAVAASSRTGLPNIRGRSCAYTARRLLNKWDPVRVIQEAYRAGRLHVLGKTTVGARAAYRAEILSSHGNATGPIVIVDAHTYMPIEMIYHGRGGSPTLVVHVRSYEELPATKANLALMRLTHHAGARVVNVTRSAGR